MALLADPCRIIKENGEDEGPSGAPRDPQEVENAYPCRIMRENGEDEGPSGAPRDPQEVENAYPCRIMRENGRTRGPQAPQGILRKSKMLILAL